MTVSLVPTGRLLLLCLAALVPMALSGSYETALQIAGIWTIGCALAAFIDARLVAPSADLEWSRIHDLRLSLGRWNRIALTLSNHGKYTATFKLRDAVPSLLAPRGESSPGMCGPGCTWTVRYAVFPLHRGEYILGPLAVRYLGPLGLTWLQRTHTTSTVVQVYPDLIAVKRYEALTQGRRMNELGLRNSLRWGTGTEFESLRDYTPDDDYRRIDWKATARVHRPIAVNYRTEQSQRIMLVLDAGRLMATRLPLNAREDHPHHDAEMGEFTEIDPVAQPARPPAALTRLDYSVNTALLLAFVSQKTGDRVGFLSFSDRVTRYVSPAPGHGQFMRLSKELYALEPDATETDFGTGFGYLASRNRRRSLVVIFTDLGDKDNVTTLITNVAYIARRHLALVVTLRDPGVEKLWRLPPDTPDRAFQGAVARRLLDARENALRYLRLGGVMTLDVSADQLSSSVINRYFEIKARTAL